MGYAGRLDPMAEGVVVVLLGKENRHRAKYLNLDKEYIAECVFGLETDTHDILGILKTTSDKAVDVQQIEKAVHSFAGKQTQNYPPYSSKTIGGVPMYKLAREGKLGAMRSLPKKEIIIHSINIQKTNSMLKHEFEEYVISKLTNVRGNFRQKEILLEWKKYFNSSKREQYILYTLGISCSSGTYIRSLVHDVGKMLKSGAVLTHLLRTKVGNYSIDDSIRL